MSVARAQEEIDCFEFGEWLAYAKKDPFGYRRLDLGFANVCAHIASANAPKGTKIKLSDYMPEFDAAPRPATPEDVVKKALSAFRLPMPKVN